MPIKAATPCAQIAQQPPNVCLDAFAMPLTSSEYHVEFAVLGQLSGSSSARALDGEVGLGGKKAAIGCFFAAASVW